MEDLRNPYRTSFARAEGSPHRIGVSFHHIAGYLRQHVDIATLCMKVPLELW